FYLAVTEVTNAQYRRFKTYHDSGGWQGTSLDGDDQPAVMVSHEDAMAFLRWLSEREGGAAYRLPSEAEWEYACRAGTTTRYWSGDNEEDLERVGWYFRNSGGRRLPLTTEWDVSKVFGEWACRSHAVGEKAANPWGLHDVHGNVSEWCEDTWHDSYEEAPEDGSAWVDGGSGHRVERGGSWPYAARAARSASRDRRDPRSRYDDLGFRPARDVATE
ncbi:MAG: formylglycine-generating enzyme family protein, partial [Planctomycetota bacterium]